MSTQLISIIVPVFNVENYLDKNLCELVNQTYSNIEIILIDDGSTDSSLSICYSWEKRDSRIRVIHQSNQGVSAARNAGLDISKGEWICFVDGDDYADRDMINTLYKEASKYTNLDMIFGCYYLESSRKIKDEHFFNADKLFSKTNNNELIRMALGINTNKTKLHTNLGVPFARLYKRSMINTYHIRFYYGLKRMQDTVFNIHILLNSENIMYIDAPIYFYKLRCDSATAKYTPDFEQTGLQLISIFSETLSKANLDIDYDNVINFKTFSILFDIFKLSVFHKDSCMGIKKQYNEVVRLCNEQVFNDMLMSEYNLYFSVKQRIVKYLLKYKMYLVVCFIFSLRYKFVINR